LLAANTPVYNKAVYNEEEIDPANAERLQVFSGLPFSTTLISPAASGSKIRLPKAKTACRIVLFQGFRIGPSMP
jgi:hypothetical protein